MLAMVALHRLDEDHLVHLLVVHQARHLSIVSRLSPGIQPLGVRWFFYEALLPRTALIPPHNPLALTSSSCRFASSGMQILRSLKSGVLAVLHPRSRVKPHLYPAFSASRISRSEYVPFGYASAYTSWPSIVCRSILDFTISASTLSDEQRGRIGWKTVCDWKSALFSSLSSLSDNACLSSNSFVSSNLISRRIASRSSSGTVLSC